MKVHKSMSSSLDGIPEFYKPCSIEYQQSKSFCISSKLQIESTDEDALMIVLVDPNDISMARYL